MPQGTRFTCFNAGRYSIYLLYCRGAKKEASVCVASDTRFTCFNAARRCVYRSSSPVTSFHIPAHIAYVSVSIRQLTSAYVSIRQQKSAYSPVTSLHIHAEKCGMLYSGSIKALLRLYNILLRLYYGPIKTLLRLY